MKRAVWIVLAVYTLGKLALALLTRGSNDVATWTTFMENVAAGGVFQVYRDTQLFNHPPLMASYLWLAAQLKDVVPNGFPFLIRLPAILADIGSLVVIVKILQQLGHGPREAAARALPVAASPVLLLVSGFHGNTDPVFMFLLLLAILFTVSGRSAILVGATVGLSLSIKVVPVLALPAFLLFFPDWKQRGRFVLGCALTWVPLFLPHILVVQKSFLRNVFGYGSLTGYWGLTKTLKLLTSELLYGQLERWLVRASKLVVLGGVWYLSWSAYRRAHTLEERRQRLPLLFSGIFLCFFIFAPGFGVQYLAWFALAGVFLPRPFFIAFQVVAGVFLVLVYGVWSDWQWYYANSFGRNGWHGPAAVLDYLLWLMFVSAGIYLISGRLRTALQQRQAGGFDQPRARYTLE